MKHPAQHIAQNKAHSLYQMLERDQTCANLDPELQSINDLYSVSQNDPEPDRYFYHTDYLGSSSWITDASGNINQHLQPACRRGRYLPFGEDFIYSWDVPYTFSGKEKDKETGYSYFGARYYNSELSVWLSRKLSGVDPMADKYPSMSPFMYTAGNPVMLKDPNGMEIKPGNEGASEIIRGALNKLFKVGIGSDFWVQNEDGNFCAKEDARNLSYSKFKRKYKKAIRKYNKTNKNNREAAGRGEGYSPPKGKKFRVSGRDIRKAYAAYEKLNSEKVYEIVVVSYKSTLERSFFANITNITETTQYQYLSNDFKFLSTTFTQIENDNKPLAFISMFTSSNVYLPVIQGEKERFLKGYVPSGIKVFPTSGNILIDISGVLGNTSKTNNLMIKAITQ